MANEELIYRITRAVYGRLGTDARESTVEQIVTDVYRAIEPLVGENGRGGKVSSSARAEGSLGGSDHEAARTGSSERLIISVFGVDRPGIVAAVAAILAEADCSIVDINQTVVQGKFAMVLIADITRARQSAAALKDRFRQEGDRLGVRIYAQREDLFNAMHRI